MPTEERGEREKNRECLSLSVYQVIASHAKAEALANSLASKSRRVNRMVVVVRSVLVARRCLPLLLVSSRSCKTGLGAMSSKVPTVVFVLGGPGAGKGTQCGRIEKVGISYSTYIIIGGKRDNWHL